MEKWNAYTRDVDGSYLCMKRAQTKPVYPGYYEATAGGSALIGEDKFACVKRELKEETGIDCDDFQEIGCQIFEDSQAIFYNYVCTVDCDKDSVVLQEGETEGYQWLSENAFIAFVNSDEMIDRQKIRYHDYFVKMGYKLCI